MTPAGLFKQSARKILEYLPHWPIRIRVTRGSKHWDLRPSEFERFVFADGDRLQVLPRFEARRLPHSLGDTHVPVARGHAIRVPPEYRFHNIKGFRIPVHLISLTGSDTDAFEEVGRSHVENYRKFLGLAPDMAILDLGSGIGRVAFQLFDELGPEGRYIGVDVTRDSIEWCQENITARYPNFTFQHFDAYSELYNPLGVKTTMDFALPIRDASIDRIVLASVFTHLLEDEVVHYLREFRRVLKSDGLVYASFILHSDEAIAAARLSRRTSWGAKLTHHCGEGVYCCDPAFPRGTVGYTDVAMSRMIDSAGLRLMRPYLKGAWSGLHDNPDDGQDAAILGVR